MAQQVGRFEIIRELGRGAQSVVYLARDPRLEREVAIKTLLFRRPGNPAPFNERLLAEARLVSQLRHPAIVPIFEADEAEGQPYLVFEYVAGQNLASFIRANGAQSAARAVAIIRPVLEALTHAHAAGIIHRDLKPSNILLDSDGKPRVMDFGIAARVAAPTGERGNESDDDFSGTPAYMAPEYISARRIGEPGDVFAAGLVLYELLFGRKAVDGGSVLETLNRIANEDIELPEAQAATLDDKLCGILNKALARDPDRRYPTIAALSAALDDYVEPEAPASSAEAMQGTVDFLIRRMRHKSDFPALSESVGTINRITESDRESIASLSNSILKDFSLTNKILRIVNSAYFRQAGGGSISTISRAVLVLGFDALRNVAITVLLFEHLKNKGNVAQLKEEFLRANLAGILAREVGSGMPARESEQVYICALFNNLGRLLGYYYFAEECERIRQLMEQKACSEEAAAIQVLGISFEELGIGIARAWGFPPLLVNSMRKLPAGVVRKAATGEEQMRIVSAFANQVCLLIAEGESEENPRELRRLAERFGPSIALSEQGLREKIALSFDRVREFASILGIGLKQSAFGNKLMALQKKRAGAATDEPLADDTTDSMLGALSPCPAGSRSSLAAAETAGDSEGATDAPATVDAAAVLTAGIQDISNTLVEDFKLNDVLRIIMETMYRAKAFKRVVLCVRDGRSNAMQGRFGFGPDAPEVARAFNFPLDRQPDIFLAALGKGVDVLISDSADDKIAARIPEWYRRGVNAGTFVIFPLLIRGKPVAMIYADNERAGDIVISEHELALLRTLRNQAVLAIKQAA